MSTAEHTLHRIAAVTTGLALASGALAGPPADFPEVGDWPESHETPADIGVPLAGPGTFTLSGTIDTALTGDDSDAVRFGIPMFTRISNFTLTTSNEQGDAVGVRLTGDSLVGALRLAYYDGFDLFAAGNVSQDPSASVPMGNGFEVDLANAFSGTGSIDWHLTVELVNGLTVNEFQAPGMAGLSPGANWSLGVVPTIGSAADISNGADVSQSGGAIEASNLLVGVDGTGAMALSNATLSVADGVAVGVRTVPGGVTDGELQITGSTFLPSANAPAEYFPDGLSAGLSTSDGGATGFIGIADTPFTLGGMVNIGSAYPDASDQASAAGTLTISDSIGGSHTFVGSVFRAAYADARSGGIADATGVFDVSGAGRDLTTVTVPEFKARAEVDHSGVADGVLTLSVSDATLTSASDMDVFAGDIRGESSVSDVSADIDFINAAVEFTGIEIAGFDAAGPNSIATGDITFDAINTHFVVDGQFELPGTTDSDGASASLDLVVAATIQDSSIIADAFDIEGFAVDEGAEATREVHIAIENSTIEVENMTIIDSGRARTGGTMNDSVTATYTNTPITTTRRNFGFAEYEGADPGSTYNSTADATMTGSTLDVFRGIRLGAYEAESGSQIVCDDRIRFEQMTVEVGNPTIDDEENFFGRLDGDSANAETDIDLRVELVDTSMVIDEDLDVAPRPETAAGSLSVLLSMNPSYIQVADALRLHPDATLEMTIEGETPVSLASVNTGATDLHARVEATDAALGGVLRVVFDFPGVQAGDAFDVIASANPMTGDFTAFESAGLPFGLAAEYAVVPDAMGEMVRVSVVAACTADLSGDGAVGAGDLAILLSAWGSGGAADLNGNGIVNGADLAILLSAWGPCSS